MLEKSEEALSSTSFLALETRLQPKLVHPERRAWKNA
jgi:hypothetical protein